MIPAQWRWRKMYRLNIIHLTQYELAYTSHTHTQTVVDGWWMIELQSRYDDEIRGVDFGVSNAREISCLCVRVWVWMWLAARENGCGIRSTMISAWQHAQNGFGLLSSFLCWLESFHWSDIYIYILPRSVCISLFVGTWQKVPEGTAAIAESANMTAFGVHSSVDCVKWNETFRINLISHAQATVHKINTRPYHRSFGWDWLFRLAHMTVTIPCIVFCLLFCVYWGWLGMAYTGVGIKYASLCICYPPILCHYFTHKLVHTPISCSSFYCFELIYCFFFRSENNQPFIVAAAFTVNWWHSQCEFPRQCTQSNNDNINKNTRIIYVYAHDCLCFYFWFFL